MAEQQNFQVDLRGIIDLLSDSLYSGPEVYVRELMQNAVDALTARQKKQPEFDPQRSTIHLEVVKPAELGATPTLVVTDAGIGLTEEEVHLFLATIGQSSKRDFSRDDFIGQFGIGLLSGFVVSEEIVVITRSIQADAPTIQWCGRADGTYSVKQLDRVIEPGTQVYLRTKPGCHEFLEQEYVTDRARHFGRHLPMLIDVSGDGQSVTVNEPAPWKFNQSNLQQFQQECLDYGKQTFGHESLDAVPLKSETGGVQGVAYILPHASRMNAKRGHRVYLKNMLLSESVENLLPDWAFFVRCVANATKLRPTASREGFYEDDTLAIAKSELGGCLKQYLVDLSVRDRQSLNRIVALHHLSIKALAVEDDEFFDLVIDWLPFETSLGTMQLGDYREHQSSIRYVQNRDEFRQIVGVAAAQKICIIDAGYTYDEELLVKLGHRSDKPVERLDISELAQEFGELTLPEREETFDFVRFAETVLQPFGCQVELKKFQPDTLPALYTLNSNAGFMRSVDQSREVSDELWDSVLDSVAEPFRQTARAQLCLNFHNPLVRRLATLQHSDLLSQSLQMLYVQSLLLGHYPLRAMETSILTDGLIKLIDSAVGSQGDSHNV